MSILPARTCLQIGLSLGCLFLFAPRPVVAQTETVAIELAGGRLTMQAPNSWEKVKPRSSMLEVEFSAGKIEDDEHDGRLTIMAAGGSVEANIDRWFQQFSKPGGGSTRDESSVKELEIGGMTVHRVDITGTFADRPRPAAPAVQRENYRMLGAIIETGGLGTYFVKFYGPKKTIDANEKKFDAFLNSAKKAK